MVRNDFSPAADMADERQAFSPPAILMDEKPGGRKEKNREEKDPV
jgi:hypothetical protein